MLWLQIVGCVIAATDGFQDAGGLLTGAVAGVDHRHGNAGEVDGILLGAHGHDHEGGTAFGQPLIEGRLRVPMEPSRSS